MRIAFIIPAIPAVSNYSGASSRVAQNLTMFQSLGQEIHIIRFSKKQDLSGVLDIEHSSEQARSLREKVASWTEICLDQLLQNAQNSPIRNFLKGLVDPVTYTFPDADSGITELKKVLKDVNPQLIWAETIEMAAKIISLAPTIPWVYSQQDWLYRVRYFRWLRKTVRDLWSIAVCYQAEIAIARSVTFALACSTTDGQRLREAGCAGVFHIPYFYDSPPEISPEIQPARDIRIIHFGGLETTANRIGLEDYLFKAHAKVLYNCQRYGIKPVLWLLGDTSTAKGRLAGLIIKANPVLTGHITNFSSAFRPFDISIIPYKHDTGFRSKLPLLFNYGQVIVATRAAIAGSWIPGIDDVCILLNRVEEFPEKIEWLSTHPEERKRLGLAGHKFAKQHFSFEAVRPLYVDLIRELSATSAFLSRSAK